MKTLISLTSFFFVFSFLSCEREEEEKLFFEGTYEILSAHITGIHTRLTSPSTVYHYRDTTIVKDMSLRITRDKLSDTLQIEGLLNDWDHEFRQTVQAIRDGDSLKIIHEKTIYPLTDNDFMRGKIWLQGDSIFLDYYWNKSDVYNAGFGAPPTYGEVKGKGIKI